MDELVVVVGVTLVVTVCVGLHVLVTLLEVVTGGDEEELVTEEVEVGLVEDEVDVGVELEDEVTEEEVVGVELVVVVGDVVDLVSAATPIPIAAIIMITMTIIAIVEIASLCRFMIFHWPLSPLLIYAKTMILRSKMYGRINPRFIHTSSLREDTLTANVLS